MKLSYEAMITSYEALSYEAMITSYEAIAHVHSSNKEIIPVFQHASEPTRIVVMSPHEFVLIAPALYHMWLQRLQLKEVESLLLLLGAIECVRVALLFWVASKTHLSVGAIE